MRGHVEFSVKILLTILKKKKKKCVAKASYTILENNVSTAEFLSECNELIFGYLICYSDGGSVAEWFRALDLKSGGPWFKSFTLLLSGFLLSAIIWICSSTTLCK